MVTARICNTSCATGKGCYWAERSSSTRPASWHAGTRGSVGGAQRSTGSCPPAGSGRGHRPVVAGTFVDPEQHRGTRCYAAGWQYLRTPGAVYACPLRVDFREALGTGRPVAKPRARPRPLHPERTGQEEHFTGPLRDVVADVMRLAAGNGCGAAARSTTCRRCCSSSARWLPRTARAAR